MPGPEELELPLGPDGLVVVPGPPAAFGLEFALTDPDRPAATTEDAPTAAPKRPRKSHGGPQPLS